MRKLEDFPRDLLIHTYPRRSKSTDPHSIRSTIHIQTQSLGVATDPQAYLAKACRLLGTELVNGGLPLDAFLEYGKGKEAGEYSSC